MAAFDTKWWHAQVNLAWRLVLHFLRKLNPFHEGFGIARFKRNYVPEGLPPATERLRAVAFWPGRCTSCAECDPVCPLLVDDAHALFPGPMQLVLSASRAAPHYADVREAIELLGSETCTECQRCEVACPEDIPILEVAAVMAEQLAVIDEAVAAEGGR